MNILLDDIHAVDRVVSALRFGAVACTFQDRETRLKLILVPCSTIADIESLDLGQRMLLVVALDHHTAYAFDLDTIKRSLIVRALQVSIEEADSLAELLQAIKRQAHTGID